ncbi:hypothetical protein BV25DRAFT_1921461 [Artomyces pyxidatus]|uniref:Uncharacterized protein n=1 Tax=Artomyces pyxidatus TaxID=48021 RepID=A0ACB8SHT7_9AGAM|nr:hypothetical protein BV25DRAFT_1921461 [Artomyces pyxidatus]
MSDRWCKNPQTPTPTAPRYHRRFIPDGAYPSNVGGRVKPASPTSRAGKQDATPWKARHVDFSPAKFRSQKLAAVRGVGGATTRAVPLSTISQFSRSDFVERSSSPSGPVPHASPSTHRRSDATTSTAKDTYTRPRLQEKWSRDAVSASPPQTNDSLQIGMNDGLRSQLRLQRDLAPIKVTLRPPVRRLLSTTGREQSTSSQAVHLISQGNRRPVAANFFGDDTAGPSSFIGAPAALPAVDEIGRDTITGESRLGDKSMQSRAHIGQCPSDSPIVSKSVTAELEEEHLPLPTLRAQVEDLEALEHQLRLGNLATIHAIAILELRLARAMMLAERLRQV